MKKYVMLALFAVSRVLAQQDADIPTKFANVINEEDYQRLRAEYVNTLRGLPADPALRANAVKMMQRQMQSQKSATAAASAVPVWTPIGPSPIPNGQVSGSLAVTGRVTAFAIDPTNTNILYLGSAQGGVYRSTDGGANWTQIFDQANTSAIGALAIAPSNHTILFVGTGEANGSGDSFAGVGVYRIDNANTTATLVGPINPIRNYVDSDGIPRSLPAFQGVSISSVVVHPTDPSIVWVGVVSGVMGIGVELAFEGNTPPAGIRGLYRLTNATASPASVAVQKIAVSTAWPGVDLPNTGNRSVDSIFMDPGNPDNLLVWINGAAVAGDGGIYRSANATSAVPTFTQVRTVATSGARAIFAGYKQGANPAVIYVASGEGNGRLSVSTDGGLTWSAFLAGGQGFCAGQCFYNIGIDVHPGATTSVADDVLVLGGNTPGSSSKLFSSSGNGGSTFVESSTGLHADTHFIRIDPSNRQVIYHGNDGGIFKTTDAGAHWASLNTSQINTVQFSGLAVHPIDPKWTLGGTQDNGTNMRDASGTWRRVDFGDGGYALVDRNATDTSHMTIYHTYFNQTNSMIGFARVLSTACAGDGQWSFKGVTSVAPFPFPNCDGSDSFNGIPLTDAVMFYAPMEMGPGNPNTVYFGAGAVYRSADKGETMSAVSQNSFSPVSTIAVSPQDDNYRIFGRREGTVFYTTTGANTMLALPGIPARYIGRVKFDPSDKETAYVTLGGYFGGTSASQSHVWKVTSLSTAPKVTAINNGLPDVPVNAFAVDPANGSNLFAGTDIGVYNSSDGGLTWAPYGAGLPVVSVFGMEIQGPSRTLRIATHGRGMWDIGLAGPPAPTVTVSVATSIAGLSFTVDGAAFASTQSLTWTVGSTHTIGTTSPQSGATGTRYVFTGWSDSGALSHSVTASATTTSYTAAFKTQYLLTTAANPPSGGTTSGGAAYYDAGSNAAISATPSGAYQFVNWTGGTFASAGIAATTVLMSGPLTATANFQLSSPGSATAFVTGYAQSSPSLRNDFAGWVGMQITAGANPLTLTSLGRACIAGNSRVHSVKLARVSDRSDVVGGAVSVNMAGCTPGQFVYSPVSLTLPAGGSYFIVSQEASGGDQWYNYGPITTTNVAAVDGAVYSTDGSSYIQYFAANNSYVPVNLQYGSSAPTPQFTLTTNVVPANGGTISANPSALGGLYNAGTQVQLTAVPAAFCTFVNWSGALSGNANPQTVTMSTSLAVTANFTCSAPSASPLITFFAATSGSLRNDFSGFVGMNFTVGANPLSVTSLGRVCVAGNSQTHAVKLVNMSTAADVPGGSAAVNMAGCTPGQFAYAPVSLTLPAGNSYYLVSQETNGGDQWYNYGGVTPTSASIVTGSVYAVAGSYFAVNVPNTSYVPVNLQYGGAAQTQYLLTTTASPSSGGSITANPAVSGNLYNSGTTVQLTAVPAANCAFTNWSGALSGSANPQSITMTSAQSVTANFQCGGQPKTSFLTGFSQAGTLRNDFGNWVGMKLTVGAAPLTVASLGRICVAGNGGVHSLKLVKPADGSDLAGGTVTVNMAGCTAGSFVYAALSNPLTLPSGARYYLVSLETAAGDKWYDYGTVSATSVAAVNGPVYFYSGAWFEVNTPKSAYVPVNFQY